MGANLDTLVETAARWTPAGGGIQWPPGGTAERGGGVDGRRNNPSTSSRGDLRSHWIRRGEKSAEKEELEADTEGTNWIMMRQFWALLSIYSITSSQRHRLDCPCTMDDVSNSGVGLFMVQIQAPQNFSLYIPHKQGLHGGRSCSSPLVLR